MAELVGISALLLVFLTILLAGGVWIAIALLATGYIGMPSRRRRPSIGGRPAF